MAMPGGQGVLHVSPPLSASPSGAVGPGSWPGSWGRIVSPGGGGRTAPWGTCGCWSEQVASVHRPGQTRVPVATQESAALTGLSCRLSEDMPGKGRRTAGHLHRKQAAVERAVSHPQHCPWSRKRRGFSAGRPGTEDSPRPVISVSLVVKMLRLFFSNTAKCSNGKIRTGSALAERQSSELRFESRGPGT